MKRGRDGEIISNKEKLFQAAEDGDIISIETIIKTNPQLDINIQNEHGWTALMIASYHGNLDVVKVLVENGADVNIQSNTGLTALMIASHTDHLDVVKLLIEIGADISIQKICGKTALIKALTWGNFDVVKALKNWRSFLPEFTIYYKRIWK